MLHTLRKNTKVILWVLLAFIVPPFIFFGIESAFVKRDDPTIATILNKKISLSKKLRYQRITSTMLRIQYPNFWQKFDLEQATWKRILFKKYAEHIGLSISDEELSSLIIQWFSNEEGFNRTFYETQVKRQLGLSIQDFEKALRDTILIDKLQQLIQSTAFISDLELKNDYLYENEKRNFFYTEFKHQDYIQDTIVNQQTLIDYYDSIKDQYRRSASRKFNYITLSYDKKFQNAQITQADIEKYYEENQDQFSGENDEVLSLNDVQPQITKTLSQEAAESQLRLEAQEIYDALLQGKTLKAMGTLHNLNIDQTPFIAKEDQHLDWKYDIEIWQDLFSEALHETLIPFRINKDYYIAQPIENRAPYIPNYEEVSEEIREAFLAQESRNSSQKIAKEKRNEINQLMENNSLSFQEACNQLSLSVEEISSFTRKDPSLNSSFMKQATWNLDLIELSGVLPTSEGYGFGIIGNIEEASLDDFEKNKSNYMNLKLKKKQQMLINDFYFWTRGQSEFYPIEKVGTPS